MTHKPAQAATDPLPKVHGRDLRVYTRPVLTEYGHLAHLTGGLSNRAMPDMGGMTEGMPLNM